MPEYKIQFDENFDNLLRQTAQDDRIAPKANSRGDVIERAVALYIYLHKQVDAVSGNEVAIVNNGVIKKIIKPLP